LDAFKQHLGEPPRFLGVQQAGNCPMFRAWKGNGLAPGDPPQADGPGLLSRIMYDSSPQTYGTFDELRKLLSISCGDLTLVDRRLYRETLERNLEGKLLLDHLEDKGIFISTQNGQVVDPTGIIALVGVIKEIDRGTIQRGSRVLCSLSSGVSDADGGAEPEFRISSEVETGVAKFLESLVKGTIVR